MVAAMQKFAALTVEARTAIAEGEHQRLATLIDENFDTRQSICQLPTGQVRMVELARAAGASAKFAGSGGAIVGTYTDASMLAELEATLSPAGCQVLKLS